MTTQHTTRKTHLNPKVHHLTKTLSAVSENALNTVDEALKTIHTQQKEYTETVKDYVHQKPYAALGIAVAAGALLALLLRK